MNRKEPQGGMPDSDPPELIKNLVWIKRHWRRHTTLIVVAGLVVVLLSFLIPTFPWLTAHLLETTVGGASNSSPAPSRNGAEKELAIYHEALRRAFLEQRAVEAGFIDNSDSAISGTRSRIESIMANCLPHLERQAMSAFIHIDLGSWNAVLAGLILAQLQERQPRDRSDALDEVRRCIETAESHMSQFYSAPDLVVAAIAADVASSIEKSRILLTEISAVGATIDETLEVQRIEQAIGKLASALDELSNSSTSIDDVAAKLSNALVNRLLYFRLFAGEQLRKLGQEAKASAMYQRVHDYAREFIGAASKGGVDVLDCVFEVLQVHAAIELTRNVELSDEREERVEQLHSALVAFCTRYDRLNASGGERSRHVIRLQRRHVELLLARELDRNPPNLAVPEAVHSTCFVK